MKAYCTLILLVISLTLLSQAEDSTYLNFDLDKYEALKEAGQGYYLLADSTKVEVGSSNSEYYLQFNPPNSHYIFVYRYFKNTLTLKRSLQFFQSNLIGIQRVYDELGILLNEYKMDSAFSFSLLDLQQKLVTEYDIDIMDVNRPISVNIFAHTQAIYNIAYPLDDQIHGTWRGLTFDGVTGEKISDIVWQPECRTK